MLLGRGTFVCAQVLINKAGDCRVRPDSVQVSLHNGESDLISSI